MKEMKKKFYHDISFWSLLVANIFTLVIAIIGNWSFSEIIWVYWGQSIAIGIVNVIRLVRLKDYVRTPFLKFFVAGFFSVHYGFFHLVYAMFLLILAGEVNFNSVLFGVGIFFINHLFSYFYNEQIDSRKKRNIGAIMFFPYFRILPMHLILIFGVFVSILSRELFGGVLVLILFLLLKTITDLGMHLAEHKVKKYNG